MRVGKLLLWALAVYVAWVVAVAVVGGQDEGTDQRRDACRDAVMVDSRPYVCP